MTTQTKKYLKIISGTLIIISKLTDPRPFWSWSTAEGVGYNVATMLIFGIGLWLIYSGGRTKINSR